MIKPILISILQHDVFKLYHIQPYYNNQQTFKNMNNLNMVDSLLNFSSKKLILLPP